MTMNGPLVFPPSRFGTLMVVSGPSGAGKTTVCTQLLRQTENLHFSVSCTTRLPRPGEEDGVDYRFLAVPDFEELLRAEAFLECARVHGNLYGTLRSEVEGFVTNGRDVLLDVDVQGARCLREGLRTSFLNGCTIFVFFAPPSFDELARRLRDRRSDSPEAIERRLSNAKTELAAWHEYDYLVVNDDAAATVDQLRVILEASHYANQRVTRHPDPSAQGEPPDES